MYFALFYLPCFILFGKDYTFPFALHVTDLFYLIDPKEVKWARNDLTETHSTSILIKMR
jgi:hypothetical protein